VSTLISLQNSLKQGFSATDGLLQNNLSAKHSYIIRNCSASKLLMLLWMKF